MTWHFCLWVCERLTQRNLMESDLSDPRPQTATLRQSAKVQPRRKLLHPETLAKLSGLELRAKRIVEGYVAGFHRSPYHGFSIEFAEHREYVPGDDLRYVDWKVFGKTDKVYLKQYEEETNMACYLTLDASESMLYQGPGSAGR